MPKVILEFDSETEAPQAAHAQQGEALWAAAQAFDEWLRRKVKYEDCEWAQEVREAFHDHFEGLI